VWCSGASGSDGELSPSASRGRDRVRHPPRRAACALAESCTRRARGHTASEGTRQKQPNITTRPSHQATKPHTLPPPPRWHSPRPRAGSKIIDMLCKNNEKNEGNRSMGCGSGGGGGQEVGKHGRRDVGPFVVRLRYGRVAIPYRIPGYGRVEGYSKL
jgi:hypothetical protein